MLTAARAKQPVCADYPHGAGIFAAPTIVEKDICETYQVSVVGRTEEVRERFYAITIERRIKHPVAMAISEHARSQLFG